MVEDSLLISVIIPTKNSSKYIARAIDSVIDQEGTFDFEIIVVDAMSDDGTREIVISYGSAVILLDQPESGNQFPNAGVAIARNHGILHANGMYCAFLDSDDVWFSDKIKKQVDILGRYPDIKLVSSQMINVYSNGTALCSGVNNKRYGDLFDVLLKKNIIFCSTVLVRTEVIKDIDVPFFAGLSTSEDWHLWIRISSIYKIFVSPDVSGIRFCRQDSLAHEAKDDPARILHFYNLYDSLLQYSCVCNRINRYSIHLSKMNYSFVFYYKRKKYLKSSLFLLKLIFYKVRSFIYM